MDKCTAWKDIAERAVVLMVAATIYDDEHKEKHGTPLITPRWRRDMEKIIESARRLSEAQEVPE